MAKTHLHSMPAPRDPEILQRTRMALEYLVTLPSNYRKGKDYPLVFCIPGYGDNAGTVYQSDKLRPYIADKYDSIVVGVRYHHDLRVEPDVSFSAADLCNVYQLTEDFFTGIGNFDNLLDRLFLLLEDRELTRLDPRCSLKQKSHQGYSSFGFLPAIDHLTVLCDLQKYYQIDKGNIIAFGTSYGGYIALLMAKYVPHTFAAVIDNSGFCLTQLREIFSNRSDTSGVTYPRMIRGKRYEIPVVVDTLWSEDETSEYYFSDAHRKIRNLLVDEHITPSDTVYYCFHSLHDTIAPIQHKDEFVEKIGKNHAIYYTRIEEKHVDGQVFKNTSHGMNASLRSLFDQCMMHFATVYPKHPSITDFEKNSCYRFTCSDKIYSFQYSPVGLEVSIKTRG